MPLIVYSHPDGGNYTIVEDRDHSQKMDDGRWEPAVLYRPVIKGPTTQWQYRGRKTFSTTKKRWAERFAPLEKSNGDPLS